MSALLGALRGVVFAPFEMSLLVMPSFAMSLLADRVSAEVRRRSLSGDGSLPLVHVPVLAVAMAPVTVEAETRLLFRLLDFYEVGFAGSVGCMV